MRMGQHQNELNFSSRLYVKLLTNAVTIRNAATTYYRFTPQTPQLTYEWPIPSMRHGCCRKSW